MTAEPDNRAREPRTLFCVKLDTLGDLVLLAPTLSALRTSWPDTRMVVLIRRAYADLAPLLVNGVEWLTTTLDPFARGPANGVNEMERLRAAVGGLKPDVVIAATSRRTWVEAVLAAESGASRRLALGMSGEDEFFATEARVRFGVDSSTAFTEYIPVDPGEPDWRRNYALADALLGRPVPRVPPRLRIPPAIQEPAASFLARHDLQRGGYVVCAAAGFSNVALKTWPADRFSASLAHARERHGFPAVLVGGENEREYLESVAAATGGKAVVWTGREGALPQLAAIVAGAAVFLGNDTGAMHLAAALDVPVVAVFGGGTWPRFVPAGRRCAAVVHPLPCFGCGWDCAFGDAPCVREITVEDVTSALDFALGQRSGDFATIREVQHLPQAALEVMARASAIHREASRGHLARQRKLEELTWLDREKDAAIEQKEAEIDRKDAALLTADASMREKDAALVEKEEAITMLKAACDQRENLIRELDAKLRAAEATTVTIAADKALIEKTLKDLPDDRGYAVQTIAGQATHIRNLEALLSLRERELTELKASVANHASGRHDVEQAKHYGKLLAEKEAVIRDLHRGCQAREAVIAKLMAETTTAGSTVRKMWHAARSFGSEKVRRPFERWLFNTVVEDYWMQIGALRQYTPRPLHWDARIPRARLRDAELPQIGIVTPSYGQEKFIERTLRSVLDQRYPRLRYVVQDGGSKDASPAIIARYAGHLHHWESVKDNGQADAIVRGFDHIRAALGPDDVMAWLNSDDLLGPGVLRFVGDYFARHPEVDVVYGHRIIVDDEDRDIGRWVMPRHSPSTLEWADYIPQETLFWRRKAWDLVGGIDPTFQFALDWDLLARFQQAGCRFVRLPYFLGAFRLHSEQKTSQAIHTTGAEEMRRIRARFHGERHDDLQSIDRQVRHIRFWGAVTARLHALGIRR